MCMRRGSTARAQRRTRQGSSRQPVYVAGHQRKTSLGSDRTLLAVGQRNTRQRRRLCLPPGYRRLLLLRSCCCLLRRSRWSRRLCRRGRGGRCAGRGGAASPEGCYFLALLLLLTLTRRYGLCGRRSPPEDIPAGRRSATRGGRCVGCARSRSRGTLFNRRRL
jgi:hypothetical protein